MVDRLENRLSPNGFRTFGPGLFFLFASVTPNLRGASAFPLDSIFARGDSSLNIVWTPDSQNTRPEWFARCCPGTPRYRVCDFIPGTEYRGEAYSYGGEDSYRLFRARLERGDRVGSHDCHYNGCGDPSDSVTGTDCSGFVCYVWKVPRQSTTGLANNTGYRRIARDSLKPGDIMVRTGAGAHAVLVVEVDYPQVLIWESSGWPVNGCRERLSDLVADTTWRSFVCLRNPTIPGNSGIVHRGGRGKGPGIVPRSGEMRSVLNRINARQRDAGIILRDCAGRILVRSGKKSTVQDELPPGVYTVEVVRSDGSRRVLRAASAN